jgi:hypothetical protein
MTRLRRQRARLDRLTIALGVVAAATTAAVAGVEVGRVWRRGSAPLPQETDSLLLAAEEAVVETAEVARVGYQEVSERENAMLNLFGSFVTTLLLTRWVTRALRGRTKLGPFRDVYLGRRHIHHFVPGIALAFVAGSAAVVTKDQALKPKLAVPLGVGMGLTLDESALLLELDDVYWTPEGVVGVQIALAATAMLGTAALGLRVLRRGEEIVLEDSPRGD